MSCVGWTTATWSDSQSVMLRGLLRQFSLQAWVFL